MVKKIRLVEDDTTADELDTQEYQAKMLEFQQAIDWKLWEILKISQAFAAREGLIEPEVTEPARTKKKVRGAADVSQIIVDEDE